MGGTKLTPALRDEANRVAAAIEDELVVEREGWAPELVARVHRRFAAAGTPLTIETAIVWAAMPQAVTLLDGRTYVSRELLSRGIGEGGLAFVLAHEQAHHDLGHFDTLIRWSARLGRLPGTSVLTSLAALMSKEDGHARELDADRSAFDRCRRAGVALDQMLHALRIIERWYLDHRALSAVWTGPLASAGTHPPVEVRASVLRALAGVRELDFTSWVRAHRGER